MKNASHMQSIFSFEEGFLAEIGIDRNAGTATIEFNAVPLRSGHPDFSEQRLAENQKRGILYSNDDARNVDLHCTGCTFQVVSWDPRGELTESKRELDLNNSVDKFQVVGIDAGQSIELQAEDIHVVMTCAKVDWSETRISES